MKEMPQAATTAELPSGTASLGREVLLVLYRSTNGRNWKNKEGWDTDADLSQWHGVVVSVHGRVVELDLESNNLRGKIPKELGKLAALQKLDLHGNYLSGYIPEALGNLSKLERLSLALNRLTGTIPKELGKLGALSELHLMGNKLSGSIPEALGALRKLEELSLGENLLKGAIPKTLGALSEMERLYLQHNKFSGPIPNELGTLRKLEKLWLHCNKLKGSIPEELCTLRELKELNLAENQLTGTVPTGAIDMRKLNKFRVGGNSALSLPPDAAYRKTKFYKWMHRIDDEDLASLRIAERVRKLVEENSQPFPSKEQQGVVLEAPISGDASDCLEFGDYADVLVERMTDPTAWPVGVGIYAQWGAGKSSLLHLILGKLKAQPTTSPDGWFTRWLWRTAGGTLIYALWARLASFCHWLMRTTGGSVVYAVWVALASVVCCRCCRSTAHEDQLDNAESGRGPASVDQPARTALGPASAGMPRVTSIVASFDAWLYADSKALWAVLISKIFNKVEDHLGKGAVRAARVRHAVTSSTCTEWCCVIITAVVVAAVGAAAGVAGEEIASMHDELHQVAAGAALTTVPISLLLWIFKVLPGVFKGQGQLILEKAESLGESVGTTQLGFMADVQEELKLLLRMLKRKSTKEHKYMLVVSIDNLDRCPHRQIVKVLEAVHLLLEKDKVNVAVMLALDPRVIIAAIEEDMGGMRSEVSGAEYLDKIIHWPFCIPTGTKQERLGLLGSWLTIGGSKTSPCNRGTDDGVRPQGGSDAHPNKELVASQDVQSGSSGRVGPDGPQPGGQTRPLDREDGGGAASGGNAAGSEEKKTDAGNTRVEAPAPFAGEEGAAPRLEHQPSTSNNAVQTEEEVQELRAMMKRFAPTPRKAKRVYNIYSIQREIARRRAERNHKNDAANVFTRDCARKLLRWTILSEFWPFHTACLVAVAMNAEDMGTLYEGTLSSLYETIGADFLSEILSGKQASGGEQESKADVHDAVRTEARRLIGFEEANEDFVRILDFTPYLLVRDLHEDKLGLLRLSFNLNPAMVARVVAWQRSDW